MKRKVALYSLAIGIFGMGAAIFNHLANGKPIRFEAVMMTPVIAVTFGYLLWLARDWAPAEGRKARAAQQREQGERGEE